MSPSKTHSKIDILGELLHSVRERHHFYELTWLRQLGPSGCLQQPSQQPGAANSSPESPARVSCQSIQPESPARVSCQSPQMLEIFKFCVENTKAVIICAERTQGRYFGLGKSPCGSAHTHSLFLIHTRSGGTLFLAPKKPLRERPHTFSIFDT